MSEESVNTKIVKSLSWLVKAILAALIASVLSLSAAALKLYIQFHDMSRDFDTYRETQKDLSAVKLTLATKVDAEEHKSDYWRLSNRIMEIKDVYNDNRKPGTPAISFKGLPAKEASKRD